MIWSIPIGFVNSVTQYALIAIGQQRFLTKAFVIGVVFNISANLVMIPRFGYKGAALVTILSEFSLFFPFYYAVRKHLTPLPWVDLLWRQAVAAVGMGVTAFLLHRSPWAATGVSLVVYAGLLILLRTFRNPDIQRVLLSLIHI